MVRREDADGKPSGSRCSSPAGGSPASVSAGAPSSRPRAWLETAVARAGRGPPDAAGPAAGGRVGPAPRRPGSSLRAAGWRSCAAGADSRSPSSPACSAYPRRRCTAGKRPAGRSPSEPVRRTHCRCCTGKSRNARLSDPARSWPERRGRRAVRPREQVWTRSRFRGPSHRPNPPPRHRPQGAPTAASPHRAPEASE